MTDRFHAFTVVLESDIRDDDAKPIIDAIRQIKGVLSVAPHVTDWSDNAARIRVRSELSEKLWKVLYPDAKVTLS